MQLRASNFRIFNHLWMADLPAQEVDIIIVGAGTAGCVLAARLATAAPELRIIVLESGPHTLNDGAVLTPGRFLENLMPGAPRTRVFLAEPSAELLGRQATVQAGGCVGGGTAINLLKLETYELETDDKSIHGFAGPMRVSRGSQTSEVGRQWLASALVWDRSRPVPAQDINDFRTADAYGAPGSNVTLRVHCSVNRVVFEGNRAAGVEYFDPRADNAPATRIVTARKLVVLSAGTFSSPMILERSGLGSPAVLTASGINVRVPLEGVGENYQDHNSIAPVYAVANGTTEGRDAFLRGDPKVALPDVVGEAIQQYSDGGKGQLSTNGIDVGAKLRPSETGIKALGEAFGKEWHYITKTGTSLIYVDGDKLTYQKTRGANTKKRGAKSMTPEEPNEEDGDEEPAESNPDKPDSANTANSSKSADTATLTSTPSTPVGPDSHTPSSHASTPGFVVQDQGNVALGVKRKRNSAAAGATDDARAQKIRAINQARAATQGTPTAASAGMQVVQQFTAVPSMSLGNAPGALSQTRAAQLAMLGQFTPMSLAATATATPTPAPTFSVAPNLDNMPIDLFSPAAQPQPGPAGPAAGSAATVPTAASVIPPSPKYKPGSSSTLQKSLTNGSSAFFGWMKFRYHIGIAFELGFPKDQASTDDLVADAYRWAFMRAPVTRKLVPEFYALLFNSLSSFRGGLKVPVMKAMKEYLGFNGLSDDAAKTLAKDLKIKLKYLFGRRSIVVAPNSPPVFEDLAFAHPVVINSISNMLTTPALSHHGSIFSTVPSLIVGGIPCTLYAFASVLIKHQLDVFAGPTKAQASFNATEYAPVYTSHLQYANQAFTTPNPVKRVGMDALRAEHLAMLQYVAAASSPFA
ncbi:FAD/NAD(P)-binding domain-containing protein [Auricularia subglabra TFB-10046 SS5]|nr:FAD/NAD(P)-binding domain-containing protein [Auricularia subglabra TFB-10046 SS5]